jgi:hypothetical protein
VWLRKLPLVCRSTITAPVIVSSMARRRVGGTRSIIRTCLGAWERIPWLRHLRRLRMRRVQRLTVCAIQRRRLVRWPVANSVSGDEGLRLGGHWSEDALLGESNAVGASSVLRSFESRASNLRGDQPESTKNERGDGCSPSFVDSNDRLLRFSICAPVSTVPPELGGALIIIHTCRGAG